MNITFFIIYTWQREKTFHSFFFLVSYYIFIVHFPNLYIVYIICSIWCRRWSSSCTLTSLLWGGDNTEFIHFRFHQWWFWSGNIGSSGLPNWIVHFHSSCINGLSLTVQHCDRGVQSVRVCACKSIMFVRLFSRVLQGDASDMIYSWFTQPRSWAY